MNCTSSKPLLDLSKHFLSSVSVPYPTTTSNDSNNNNSYRSGVDKTSFRSDSTTKESIRNEFEQFGQGGSLSNGVRGGGTSNLIQSISGADTTVNSSILQDSSEDSEGEEELSSNWNPEFETFQYISSVSSFPSYSNSSYCPQSKPSTAPCFEEAISISSTPPITTVSRSDISSTTAESSTATPPHPLTFTTPSHSAWDFDKLFSRRRRWYGGIRIPNDDMIQQDQEMISQDDTSEEARGRTSGIESTKSIGGTRSNSGLRNELTPVPPEERRKEVFESLTKVAMARLNALAGHF